MAAPASTTSSVPSGLMTKKNHLPATLEHRTSASIPCLKGCEVWYVTKHTAPNITAHVG
jgi:hypothetical protein